MHQIKLSSEGVTAVKAFQIKLTMARLNATKKSTSSEALKRDSSGHFFGEFDISGLPTPVKKHIITAGIIQGDIFQYGDGFAYIKEVVSQSKTPFIKTHYLQVRALKPKSYENALGIIEILIDEVLEPQKKTPKRLTGYRSWKKILTNEFEIQSLIKPVISHVITKGIIKGDIHQFTGAIVNAKGSPYLSDNLPKDSLSERPIYLLIQGPDENTLYWAVDRIKKLIKEAEEIINNEEPEVVFVGSNRPSEVPVDLQEIKSDVTPVVSHELDPKEIKSDVTPVVSHKLDPKEIKSDVGARSVDELPQPAVERYPPFLPQLGQTVEAFVTRCAVLVQWLLAHPLLVSFMASPPAGCESKIISKKIITAALMCIPLYEQYVCTHLVSKKICANCHNFFSEAQKTVYECFEAVVNQGYDISLLICVDDYIKDLAANPENIGVLYDYPVPLNLFYIDSCRLFIDLVVNCGFEIDSNMIESYLRCTQQWYPVKAFENIVVKSQVNPCPSKNPKTHQYPLYGSLDHHGGLINFHLGTIGNASPGQLFPADAPKIPKCKYFPFLNKLSVFSQLYNYSKKIIDVSERKIDEITGSISLAAYQMTRELKKAKESITSPQRSHENLRRNSQSPLITNPMSRAAKEQPQDTQKLQGSLPPSFSVMRDPNEKPTSMAGSLIIQPNKQVLESRKLRKKMRKEMLIKKKEEEIQKKRKEIDQTLAKLREKHGSNSFWTMNPSELEAENVKDKLTSLLNTPTSSSNRDFSSTQAETPTMPLLPNSVNSPDLQQVLSNMQMSMPSLQPTLIGTQQFMPARQERGSLFKPPILIAEQILGSQQPVNDRPKDDSQENALSDVINQLEEFIQTTGKKTTDGVENNDSQMYEETTQQLSHTKLQSEPNVSSVQKSASSVEKTTAEGKTNEDSAYSAIIDQLQQFINSTSQISSQDNTQKETSIAEKCEKTPKPVESKINKVIWETSGLDFKRKNYPSPLKRSSTEVIAESFQLSKPKVGSETTKEISERSRSHLERKADSPFEPVSPEEHEESFQLLKPKFRSEKTKEISERSRSHLKRKADSPFEPVSPEEYDESLQLSKPKLGSEITNKIGGTSRFGLQRKANSPFEPVSREEYSESFQPLKPKFGREMTKEVRGTSRFGLERKADYPFEPALPEEYADSFQPSQPKFGRGMTDEDRETSRFGYERKADYPIESASPEEYAESFQPSQPKFGRGMADVGRETSRFGYERRADYTFEPALPEEYTESFQPSQPKFGRGMTDEGWETSRFGHERKADYPIEAAAPEEYTESFQPSQPKFGRRRTDEGWETSRFGHERKADYPFEPALPEEYADSFQPSQPKFGRGMTDEDRETSRFGYERKADYPIEPAAPEEYTESFQSLQPKFGRGMADKRWETSRFCHERKADYPIEPASPEEYAESFQSSQPKFGRGMTKEVSETSRLGYERNVHYSPEEYMSTEGNAEYFQPSKPNSSQLGFERKTHYSPLKRVSKEVTNQPSKPKRSFIEFNNQASATSATSNPSCNIKATTPTIRPISTSSSVKERLGEKSKISTDVSILGDSLLTRARKHFGGLTRHDLITDSNTISALRKHVISYINKGGELRPYCLVMCGVNDVINKTDPRAYVKQLKILLNFLISKQYYVLLATLPPYISTDPEINKAVPVINGMILSFNTKKNLTVIPFHKLYLDHENQKSLLSSVQTDGKSSSVVLSDSACELIQLQIEFEVPALR